MNYETLKKFANPIHYQALNTLATQLIYIFRSKLAIGYSVTYP